MNKLLPILATTFAFSSVQAAPSVSFILGVDDYADIYLSTDDTLQGDFIGSAAYGSWPPQTISANLNLGVTNYIHILVQNFGGPDGISGEFRLSNSSFEFSNGTQYLVTQPSTVSLSATGFGTDYQTPVSFGPISNFGSYFSDPYSTPELTENISGAGGPSYFSIPIYAVATVPEPENIALFLAGLGILGIATRRK